MDKIRYKKLPGRSRILGSARLWLGPDHILSQKSSSFNENYKRFYFSDIQAISVSKTNRGKIINIILLSLTALIGIFYVDQHFGTPLIGLVFLVSAFINTIMGPTSKGYLITAVTREELPSLNRMRNALKVINTLKLHIERVQGRISREELAGGLTVSFQTSGRPEQKTHVRDAGPRHRQSRPAPSSLVVKESKRSSYNGTYHIILFALVLASAFMTTADHVIVSIPLTLLHIFISFIVSFFIIVCLVKQQGASISNGLKNTTWGLLIFIVVKNLLGIPVYMYMIMSGKIELGAITQWQQIISIASYPADTDIFLTVINVFSALGDVSLGIVGTLAYRRSRQASRNTGTQ